MLLANARGVDNTAPIIAWYVDRVDRIVVDGEASGRLKKKAMNCKRLASTLPRKSSATQQLRRACLPRKLPLWWWWLVVMGKMGSDRQSVSVRRRVGRIVSFVTLAGLPVKRRGEGTRRRFACLFVGT